MRQGEGSARDHRHPDRLRHPLKRTNPKGANDPGWQRIGWDEALDIVADRLRASPVSTGPESVVFSSVSPSTSAIVDCVDWIQRLERAFGSPNLDDIDGAVRVGRYLAPLYTYGAAVPGQYMPDLDGAECILFWGYNPVVSRLAHATAARAALRRGAKLIVVDPRQAGLATKADLWMRVRPGTDAALAMAITNVMIDRGWFDESFVRRWTNGPLLVRVDTGRLLRARDLDPDGGSDHYVAWDGEAGRPVVLDPAARGTDVPDHDRLVLAGSVAVPGVGGTVECRTAFDLLAEQSRSMPPALAEEITGVAGADIERTAELMREHRPVVFYTWSGLEQHSGTTQIIRAINVLYALTGCFDAPGGNVAFTPVPTNSIAGMELLTDEQRSKTIGVRDRPLGPARVQLVTGEDFYTAALEGRPYRARAASFGSNLLMAHGDSRRGRDALQQLDFQVHLDMFMTPTAEQADIVLPVTGAFESEGLKVGFEVSQDAQSLVQLRGPLVPPVGEARSDIEVIFDLAVRLGLGDQFFGGNVDAGWAYQLEPSGITLGQLRDEPGGVRLPVETRHRKYASVRDDGVPAGFNTPTGRIELYVERFLDIGQPAVPTFTQPALSPRSRRDLAGEFPLVLTCAKSLHFCETQHRQVASLRRHVPEPQVELHPDTAAARGIAAGDWVELSTPKGSICARAALNDTIAPDVVCGQHGWFEACEELGISGFPPFGPGSANLNLVLSQTPSDPISGELPPQSPALPGRTAPRGLNRRRMSRARVESVRGLRSAARP